MIAPIDIVCPACAATAGNRCTSATVNPRIRATVTFHHAERIDAAFRHSPSSKRPSPLASPRDFTDEDMWLEFLGPPGAESYCGLCGNFGVVDTRGKVVSPRGGDCGVRAFCICPNGRSMKQEHGGELPPEEEPSTPTSNKEVI